MQIDEMLMKALTTYDNNRERSQQTQIGVSQIEFNNVVGMFF